MSLRTNCKFTCYCSMCPDDMSGFGRSKKLASEDYYMSPEGFIVFTEAYHRKRGYCCKSGCKHCPYGYDKGTGKVNPKKSNS